MVEAGVNWLATAVGCILLTTSTALAGPDMINVQGIVRDDTSWLNTNGMSVTFAIYDQPTGGTPLYREDDVVNVSEGHYASCIGDNPASETPCASFAEALRTAGTNAWLGITLAGEPEFEPRERLLAAPFVVGADNTSATQTVTHLEADNLTANSASFPQGIEFVAPGGDLSMGAFVTQP